jgi:hypothetical protein
LLGNDQSGILRGIEKLQWHFSKLCFCNGIFPKCKSCNGIDPINPNLKELHMHIYWSSTNIAARQTLELAYLTDQVPINKTE